MRKSTHATRAKEKTKTFPSGISSLFLGSSRGGGNDHLSLVKKESQLISKNPKRFLDSYVEGKASVNVSKGVNEMLAGVEKLKFEGVGNPSKEKGLPKSDAELLKKAQEFEDNYKLSKNRTLLLNMSTISERQGWREGRTKGLFAESTFSPKLSSSSGGSTPTPTTHRDWRRLRLRTRSDSLSSVGSAISSSHSSSSSTKSRRASSSMDKKASSHQRNNERHVVFSEQVGTREDDGSSSRAGYYDSNLDKNNASEVEAAMQQFIERIKNSDIDNIIVWINTLASMNDVQLPFGFPSTLTLPLNPEDIKETDLRSFAESASDDFVLLDGEYSAKMEEICKRLRENWDSLQSSRWTPKDSALLFYIITALEDSATPGVAGLRGELLAKLFPSFGEEQIALQKYRLRTKRAWEEKRGAILKDWIRDRDDLTQKVNEGWAWLQQQLTKKLELATEHRAQQDRTIYWRQELDKLRKEKRLRIRRIQLLVEPFEKIVEERTRSRLEEDEREKREKRMQLVKFREEQARKKDQERKERERRAVEGAKHKKLMSRHNQTRIVHRQHVLEQKQEAAQELERAKERESALKKELLEKTKIKVEIDYHPANLLADTHASLLHRKEIPTDDYLTPEEEDMIAFFRSRYNNTFSSDRVMRDRRLRVETKLREAGLLESLYARQVLLSMEPRPKPHLVSNIEFKEDDK